MFKFIFAIVALLAVGGTAAGAAVYLTNSGGTAEDVPPPAVVQTSPEPSPGVTTAAPVTAETPAPDDWTTYKDAEIGFSFPHPPGLTVTEEFFDLPEKGGNPSVRLRILTFRDSAGVPGIGVAIAPNPKGLSVEEWVEIYPGWPTEPPDWQPSEPELVTIGGERGLLFLIDQMGQRFPQTYFKQGDFVFTLQANVYGIAESGYPPVLSEADSQRVIDGFSFGP